MDVLFEFPSAESVVIGYLSSALPVAGVTAPVSTRPRDPRPPEFILVSRTGGERVSLVQESVRLLFECYGVDDVASDRLARRVRAVMLALGGEFVKDVWVYGVREVAGIVDHYDVERQLPRRQFEVAVTVRGHEI